MATVHLMISHFPLMRGSVRLLNLVTVLVCSQVSVPANFRNSPFSRSPENPAIYGTSHSEFLFHTSLRSLIAPQIAD
ncbi:hypothetical protein AAZV13_06G057700 [Glycine max]